MKEVGMKDEMGNKSVQIEKEGEVVKRVRISEEFSDEKGELETIFHFRIEKEVGASNDPESPVYCQVKWQHKKPIPEENYNKLHKEIYPQILAKKAECEPQYITPITKEEYDAEMNEGRAS